MQSRSQQHAWKKRSIGQQNYSIPHECQHMKLVAHNKNYSDEECYEDA
jgi:hypothetical protein